MTDENRDERGRFKKGMKAWNFKHGKKLKRKYKRFNGKLILNAHFVWLNYNSLKEIPKGYVIHHKDGDSLNDNIENLILMEDIEHRKFHNRKAGDDLIHSPNSAIESKNEASKDTPDGEHSDTSQSDTSGTHSQQDSGSGKDKNACRPAGTGSHNPACTNKGCGDIYACEEKKRAFVCGKGSLCPECGSDNQNYTNLCKKCGHVEELHGSKKGCKALTKLDGYYAEQCGCKKFTSDKKGCKNCGGKNLSEVSDICHFCGQESSDNKTNTNPEEVEKKLKDWKIEEKEIDDKMRGLLP